jgi:lysophospholipase L1-like esterase
MQGCKLYLWQTKPLCLTGNAKKLYAHFHELKIKFNSMKVTRIIIPIVSLFLLFCAPAVNAQDPERLIKQVEALSNAEYNFPENEDIVLFTGSSTIRMWVNVQSYFPDHNVINNGFGGSQMSDLLYFYDDLILKSSPEVIFIYEGDNDIASEKNSSQILKTTKELIGKIKTDLPESDVILISPKPSIARWHLSRKYKNLNRKLSKYCDENQNLEFADVWNAMLDDEGMVFQDIFLEDGLHMNEKGYDIWAPVIGKFITIPGSPGKD